MPPEPASLAARLKGAPVLADAKRARARLADLLARAAEKPEAEPLARLAETGPFHDLLLALADHSPFLWQLTSADPARTTVTLLERGAVVGEIVRMLGADSDDVAARRHAKELLKAA